MSDETRTKEAMKDAEDESLENLEAASDMWDALIDGTFYRRHEEALEWLRSRK